MSAATHVLRRCGAVFASVLAAVLLTAAAPSRAQQATYDDNQVKAAFLARFAQFVEWPEGAFQPTDGALVITVAGSDAVHDALAQLLAERPRQGRTIVARMYKGAGEIASTHMLFVGAEAKSRIDQYVAAIEGRPVLVVTDFADALDHGAVINFRHVDRRVRFEISLQSAEKAKLALSSRLLSLATRIRRGAVFSPALLAALREVPPWALR